MYKENHLLCLTLFGGQSPQAAPGPCSPTIMAFADSIFSTLEILHCDVIGYFTESSKKNILQSNSAPGIYRNTTAADIQNCKYYYEMVQVCVNVSVFCFVLKFMLVAVL